MIVTVTANPSLDRTVRIGGQLIPGGVHRIEAEHTDAGGKGINVALGLHRAGLPALAIYPAPAHDRLGALLDRLGVAHATSPLGGPVRTNLTILSDGGVTTKVNEPGVPMRAGDVAAFEHLLADCAGAGDAVMLCGSLPPGMPEDAYVRLAEALHARAAWVGLDTSDAPLRAILGAPEAGVPDFLKPNASELAQLAGGDGVDFEARAAAGDFRELAQAVARVRARGVAHVLVTLGAAGAVLATRRGTWIAAAPRVPVASTVGAGDAAVAGFLAARAERLGDPDRLRLAVAYGARAVTLPGTALPTRREVQPGRVSVRSLSPTENQEER